MDNAPIALAPDAAAAPSAQIGFGLIRHTRLRPRRHAFGYPAYFLRLPVRSLAASLGDMGLISHNRWNLFSFHDADHTEQNFGAATHLSPEAWIDQRLLEAGILDATGEVWLHTFPRVLGYVFNPVSFWFCHRPDGALRAVLCAVSNTFGERHYYLLDHADGSALRSGEELSAVKVFHVSPFCNIEGGYCFRFITAREQTVARVDYHDREGPLLNTSMSGALVSISDRQLARAFFFYPLFTFGVVLRIHLQAFKLWRKRIPYFSKPAPPISEVSR